MGVEGVIGRTKSVNYHWRPLNNLAMCVQNFGTNNDLVYSGWVYAMTGIYPVPRLFSATSGPPKVSRTDDQRTMDRTIDQTIDENMDQTWIQTWTLNSAIRKWFSSGSQLVLKTTV